jgi:hypothetical protein
LATTGKDLMAVAKVDGVLHFRIFDADGKMIVDTDERQLTDKAPQIKDFKDKLAEVSRHGEKFVPDTEKNRDITALASIFGKKQYEAIREVPLSPWLPLAPTKLLIMKKIDASAPAQ